MRCERTGKLLVGCSCEECKKRRSSSYMRADIVKTHKSEDEYFFDRKVEQTRDKARGYKCSVRNCGGHLRSERKK